jgi:hypothetical protein
VHRRVFQAVAVHDAGGKLGGGIVSHGGGGGAEGVAHGAAAPAGGAGAGAGHPTEGGAGGGARLWPGQLSQCTYIKHPPTWVCAIDSSILGMAT